MSCPARVGSCAILGAVVIENDVVDDIRGNIGHGFCERFLGVIARHGDGNSFVLDHEKAWLMSGSLASWAMTLSGAPCNHPAKSARFVLRRIAGQDKMGKEGCSYESVWKSDWIGCGLNRDVAFAVTVGVMLLIAPSLISLTFIA